jgi:hypothetical protein
MKLSVGLRQAGRRGHMKERPTRGVIGIIVATAFAAVTLLIPAGPAAAPTPPALAWSPTTSSNTFDYGTVAVGQTAAQKFTLTEIHAQ